MGNLGDNWILRAALQLHGPRKTALLLEPSASVAGLEIGAELPVLRWPGIRDLAEINRFRAALRAQWDAVLFIGGGWLAGDQNRREPVRWSARFKMLPIPYGGHALGIGPFPQTISRLAARTALRNMPQLSVRTSIDALTVRDLTGTNPPIHKDLALSTSPLRTSQGGLDDLPITVVMPAPQRHWLPMEMHACYASAVLALARRVAAGREVQVMSFDHAADVRYWEEHALVLRPTTINEAFDLLAMSSTVIAGRLHAVLASALANRPIIAFGYGSKFSATSCVNVFARPITDIFQAGTLPRVNRPMWDSRLSINAARDFAITLERLQDALSK